MGCGGKSTANFLYDQNFHLKKTKNGTEEGVEHQNKKKMRGKCNVFGSDGSINQDYCVTSHSQTII